MFPLGATKVVSTKSLGSSGLRSRSFAIGHLSRRGIPPCCGLGAVGASRNIVTLKNNDKAIVATGTATRGFGQCPNSASVYELHEGTMNWTTLEELAGSGC